jgi:hypothetical protein
MICGVILRVKKLNNFSGRSTVYSLPWIILAQNDSVWVIAASCHILLYTGNRVRLSWKRRKLVDVHFQVGSLKWYATACYASAASTGCAIGLIEDLWSFTPIYSAASRLAKTSCIVVDLPEDLILLVHLNLVQRHPRRLGESLVLLGKSWVVDLLASTGYRLVVCESLVELKLAHVFLVFHWLD